MEINKSYWHSDGDRINLSVPFFKVDKERRIVSGFATLDNVDRHKDIVDANASMKAFETFRGNLREMHQPIAVGKVTNFREEQFFDKVTGETYRGVFVDTYVSKGAQDTWEKVLDGTLSGFSIGGNITKVDQVQKGDEMVRVIKEYELVELSLVDSPANQLANIFAVQKADGVNTITGIAVDIKMDNIFWCENDQIAVAKDSDSSQCLVCESEMVNIGWVESNDVTKNEEIDKAVDRYLSKAAPGSLKTGDFVSWNSSGGTARGRIEHIMRNGTLGIPNSDFAIEATPEDPAVLIRIWRQSGGEWKETETLVGHKMSTLTKINDLNKSLTDDEDIEKAGPNSSRLLPLAERDRPWDGSAAEMRVREWASSDGSGNKETINWSRYSNAFAWHDASMSDNFTSYKLGFADIINGELTAVPRGVFAAAAALQGARGGVMIPEADKNSAKSLLSRYYNKMRTEFNDESIQDPFSKLIDNDNIDEGGVAKMENNEVIEESLEEVVKSDGCDNCENCTCKSAESEDLEKSDSIEESSTDLGDELLEKSDEVSEVEEPDFAKMLDDLKTFFGENISKSAQETKVTVEELSKSIDAQITELADKHDALSKAVENIKSAIDTIEKRVDLVENETAVKKSRDLEGSKEEKTIRKGIWSGTFLGARDL